ncbi:NAD(P)/FAD-dependent oxidoreductase [Flavobacterium sp. 3HN19-14]|uniref:NAD(P)/FAD-dependent oxidoreductase n=1 Tax=Flavobacterium sp. 3HN19-14 TaxID=3448133 RepID=UPI003EE3335E
MTDYLIVGCGLAGIAFAEKALDEGKSIIVFDHNQNSSSRIAGGLYNPVILKRFSEVWRAKEQLQLLEGFYQKIEEKLNFKFNYKLPILRKFYSVEEQNDWFTASDKPNLSDFLSTKIVTDKIDGIDAPFNYGEVLHTGYVDTVSLIEKYKDYLIDKSCLIDGAFDYNEIVFKEDYIQYQFVEARHIIFAEGFGIHSNPYFRYLPVDGTKGELFIIKAPELKLDLIVNTSVFILPLGNGLFKVGATYDPIDKTQEPTEDGKQLLIERIKEILSCDFEIIAHFAGIRPTVKDRRPLIGTHPEYSNLHVINGLGTRGVMLWPQMAKELFENIECGTTIDKEADIRRYEKRRSLFP